MSQPQKPRIGITLGDLNGVGPEVVMKALQDNRMLNLITPVVYGSTRALSFYKKQLNIEEFSYGQIKARGQYIPKTINVVNCWEDVIEINPGKPTKETGKAAWLALKQATLDLKENLIDALVTAPIDKNTIASDEFPYRGHTEYLANTFNTKDFVMMMVSEKLRVGLATEHIAVKDITGTITQELLNKKLTVMEQSLRKDFGITKPKIAVLGLNPHAGDGGVIGTEDDQVIKPVIQEWKNKGKVIAGPFPADGFFASGNYARFDATLAMYHDQGLIPFKLLAFETGVNFTAGLSAVRTSPDHGTGYSIAGKNMAQEGSLRQAIYAALDIVQARSESLKS
ncbi:MAG: 4-hydroxythreonine-4-phosphate dehydrogenase PdxA [Cyclobacteriaceae bacterium]|nr:4-hydroxythreonine-4-phosphate dehydrogenase PdxA [Cyclobacteriaceae bacterium]